MAILTKDQILGADDLEVEEVDVSQWWGGSVLVQSLTGTERDAFEADIFEGRGKNVERNFVNLRTKLLVRTIINENKKLMFSEKDIVALGKKCAAPLDKIFAVAQRLSGLTPKDVEDMTKNSSEGQSADSISD